jgi:hypothetical protein
MAFDAATMTESRPLPRTMDAGGFNAAVNSPDVRLGLGRGTEPLDFASWFADPANIAFADERGGFFLHNLGFGRYELHTAFSHAARGAEALRLCGDVIRRMFVETDCLELVTRVPGNLRHADLMARKAGFRERWTMAEAWPGPAGEQVSLTVFGIGLEDWVLRDSSLVTEGEAFHAMLRSAADRAGHHAPLHEHDDVLHERYAGVACLMAKAGNHGKAIRTYTSWAVLAGYRPLQLITEHPAIYDTGNALVQVHGGNMEILRWSLAQ